ncbi:unnamed protein product [Spodoptera exigua]|nr:unnamed protein product [Spodoptera exigua]
MFSRGCGVSAMRYRDLGTEQEKEQGELLTIKYPSGSVVTTGKELTPTQVKDQPVVQWAAKEEEYYTLAMVDPDAPSREDPKFREWHHWLNLNTFDPFADAIKSSEDDVQDGLVHVRIQQRNGRKTLTTVQGLSSEYDLKKIVRACKKEFACNGTVVEHPEYGEVLQLQGDQRENICQWLTKSGLVKPEQLKVHGF